MLVKEFPLLADHPELREAILSSGSVHQFEAGTVLLQEGRYIKVIPFLLKGLLRVYKEDESGHEVLLYYIKSGESCVMSFTTFTQNEKSTVRGVVEEDAEIFVLPAEDAWRIAKKHAEFNQFFYELFRNKYNELLHVIQLLSFSNMEERILDYLENQASIKQTRVIHKTHQQIADDLGSSREVISRALKKLEIRDLVKMGQGRIEILG